MFDCPTHGRTGYQHGCRHFEEAVDGSSPIAVVKRNYRGSVFLVCLECAESVDAARGFSSETCSSDEGMSPHVRHVACMDCTLEAYLEWPDDALIAWMRTRYQR